ncbi:hypothetical protein BDQ17DRAFT_1430240 [Cyathus striatus]|nr:hypothetical protein BDQ17DRAFT_1430240 [Cyathus striatus]
MAARSPRFPHKLASPLHWFGMAHKKFTMDQKLTRAVKSLTGIGFRSPNEFVQAFYSSEKLATQALRFREDASYAPSQILTAWLCNVPKDSHMNLNLAITQAASDIIIAESTKACRDTTLQFSSSGISVPYLATEFGLDKIQERYDTHFPCFSMILLAVLTARNDYEHWNNTDKIGKTVLANQVIVFIISMCLFFRNRATNAFQLVIGLFLSSSGVSRRAIGIFNHMGLLVSYQTIQSSLCHLSNDAKLRAQEFACSPTRLWGVVYDNINFTLRKASQHLDSTMQQINATTSALFLLPLRFSRAVYTSLYSTPVASHLNQPRSIVFSGDITITISLSPAIAAAIASNPKTSDFPYPVPAITIASFPSATFSNTFSCHGWGLYPYSSSVTLTIVSIGMIL